ncbi:MAG: alkaline shock response membrane anchor protein AmaP [Peptococcaceae bacterium]|nr:alkaline shock response membrane anchor protein AmaP [Peptococcaceae bacterium]
MNPFDRGLMVLYALAGTLSAVVSGLLLAGWAWPEKIFRDLAGMPGFNETVYSLLAVFILAGIRLAWKGLHPGKRHAVVQEGSLGKVRIALAAIESLVEKVAMDQRGVKEARAGVEGLPRGIGVRIRVVAAPDVNIPQVSELIQKTVRDRVLEVTGIEVRDIRISVDNIAAQKLRVE